MLNARKARGYVFFRRCTRPSKAIVDLIAGGWSRNRPASRELALLRYFPGREGIPRRGTSDRPFSRSRSMAPAERSMDFITSLRMNRRNTFRGQSRAECGSFWGTSRTQPSPAPWMRRRFRAYPAAYWLEPAWRDTNRFDQSWLLAEARDARRGVADASGERPGRAALLPQFEELVSSLETRILE